MSTLSTASPVPLSNPDLEHIIKDRLAHSTHRVLIQALANVGECTYAVHYPRYASLFSLWYASHWKPVPIRRSNVWNDIRIARREMYRQPCLVCDWCRRRRRLWSVKT